jgi:hypothetical protein
MSDPFLKDPVSCSFHLVHCTIIISNITVIDNITLIINEMKVNYMFVTILIACQIYSIEAQTFHNAGIAFEFHNILK